MRPGHDEPDAGFPGWPSGSVTGIDLHAAQLEQAGELCAMDGLDNATFVQADACKTGLPRDHFDLVYCRFLLMHLTDPSACLQEMWQVLKPGGILLVEDGDLCSAASVPPTALNAFADLFSRLAPLRGVDYSLANRLCHLVAGAGFANMTLKVHQPADTDGQIGYLMKWTIEEAGPAFVEAGLISATAAAAARGDGPRCQRPRCAGNRTAPVSLVSGRKRVN